MAFYWLQLLTGNAAFEGMHPIRLPEFNDPFSDIIPIFFIWDDKTIVDCLYFSVVTIGTVGYGDIHPKTSVAKLFTASEIIIGFIIIVLSISSIVNNRDVNE